jgi:hypothetical protein
MSSSSIERISIPNGSLAEHAFKRIDYADTYRVQLLPNAPRDIDLLYETVFSLPPNSWIGHLMSLRNSLVRLIGLKTVASHDTPLPQRALQPGDKTRFLKVVARSANELLLGEDDKHLDLRVSVLRQENETSAWLVVTTVVQFNNWFGRLYFLPVRPVHQRLVPWMLKKAAQTLTAKPAAAVVSSQPVEEPSPSMN